MSSEPLLPPAQFPKIAHNRSRSPRVEGASLVVPSGVELPPICVKTNQLVSEQDMMKKSIIWHPEWLLILLLFGALPLIIAYYLTRKKCTITFGLAPEVRQRYRRVRMAKGLIALISLAGIFAAAALDIPSVAVVLVLTFFVSLAAWLLHGPPLRATHYQNNMFWIKGACDEFLDSVQEGIERMSLEQAWAES